MWPVNSELTKAILQDDFYDSVERATNARFYSKFSTQKTMEQISEAFASLGSVPEIRQMSGVTGGGPRQAIALKDWVINATALEWEQTIPIRRIFAQSKPAQVRAKVSQTAQKAVKGLDRTFCQALASTTALGYDAIALFSASHPESGTNQTNLSTTAGGGGGSATTAAQVETALITATAQFLGETDDQGTPVNEGVARFTVLCHPTQFYAFKGATSPLLSNQAIDSMGTKGELRGVVDLIPSAYCTTTGLTGGATTRAYLFAADGEANEFALARGVLADWQFNTNIGDEGSDDWNKGEGWIRSWSAFLYFPWQWQAAQQITFS